MSIEDFVMILYLLFFIHSVKVSNIIIPPQKFSWPSIVTGRNLFSKMFKMRFLFSSVCPPNNAMKYDMQDFTMCNAVWNCICYLTIVVFVETEYTNIDVIVGIVYAAVLMSHSMYV